MESNIFFQVYYNGGMINVVPGFISFYELRNNICQSIDSHISKVVSSILYRSPVVVFGRLMQFQTMPVTDDASMRQMFQIHWNTRAQIPLIKLYVEFEDAHVLLDGYDSDVGGHREITWYEDNNHNEDDLEASCGFNNENENVGEEEEDNTVRQIAMEAITRQQQSISRTSNLEAMHAPEFPQYANQAVVGEDGEFCVVMEFGSRKLAIATIRSYTKSGRNFECIKDVVLSENKIVLNNNAMCIQTYLSLDLSVSSLSLSRRFQVHVSLIAPDDRSPPFGATPNTSMHAFSTNVLRLFRMPVTG
ncbi:hypothetical protein PIB30_000342 [Stylosanthes scabra]|uniref:Uncharacterized protein n=1 Tax=Stylosanthes scabra TaxID=79078 RepID=A0ABU6T489_9FABA|nr:hypothetical protein [Stylosanthes scabra]